MTCPASRDGSPWSPARTPAWGSRPPGSWPRAARRWCWPCRTPARARQAAARIAGAAPGADVTVQTLDLASLESIRAAAAELRARHPAIDLLVNNAGVMFTSKHATADGFELQLGTNHL